MGVVKPQNSSHKVTQSLTETAPRLRVSRKRLLTECSGELGKQIGGPDKRPVIQKEIASPIRKSGKQLDSWTDVERLLGAQRTTTEHDSTGHYSKNSPEAAKAKLGEFRFSSPSLGKISTHTETAAKQQPPKVVEIDPGVIQRGLALQKMQEFQKLKRRLTEHRPTLVFSLALQKKPAVNIVKQVPTEHSTRAHAASSGPSRIFQVQTDRGKTAQVLLDNFRIRERTEANFSTQKTTESFDSLKTKKPKKSNKVSHSTAQAESATNQGIHLEKYDTSEAYLLAHRCRHLLEVVYEQFSSEQEEPKLNYTIKELLGLDGDPKNPLRDLLFHENTVKVKPITDLTAFAIFHHVAEVRGNEFLDESVVENGSGTYQPSYGSKGEQVLNNASEVIQSSAPNRVEIKWPVGRFQAHVHKANKDSLKLKSNFQIGRYSESSLDMSVSKRDINTPRLHHGDGNDARFLLESPRARYSPSKGKRSLFAGPACLDVSTLPKYKVKALSFEALMAFTSSVGKFISTSRSSKHNANEATVAEKIAVISRVSSILRTKQQMSNKGQKDVFEYFGSSSAMRNVPVCQEIRQRTENLLNLEQYVRKVERESRIRVALQETCRKDNRRVHAVLSSLPEQLC